MLGKYAWVPQTRWSNNWILTAFCTCSDQLSPEHCVSMSAPSRILWLFENKHTLTSSCYQSNRLTAHEPLSSMTCLNGTFKSPETQTVRRPHHPVPWLLLQWAAPRSSCGPQAWVPLRSSGLLPPRLWWQASSELFPWPEGPWVRSCSWMRQHRQKTRPALSHCPNWRGSMCCQQRPGGPARACRCHLLTSLDSAQQLRYVCTLMLASERPRSRQSQWQTDLSPTSGLQQHNSATWWQNIHKKHIQIIKIPDNVL